MTLRARLALGILAIAMVLVVPLAIAVRSLDRLHQATADLRSREFTASLLLGRIRGRVDDLRGAELRLISFPDTSARDQMLAEIRQLRAKVDSLAPFQLDSAADHMRTALNEVAKLTPLEYALALEAKRDYRTADRVDSLSSERIRPAIQRIEYSVRTAELDLNSRTVLRVDLANLEAQRARSLSAGALFLASLLATAIAAWLTRTISRPVRDLERGMKAVADGQFEHKLSIAPRRHDEFGRLAASYQTMARQLAELDKLKAEFVSVASHELKTPINVIVGYIQLLEDGVFGDLTPKQREICQTIETQCNALSRLVYQLLDVSRFEAGGGKLDVRLVDLASFLDELETAFQVLARQRGIDFVVVRGEDLPAEVLWDPDRMNEVLGNLLSNAFKFTERGGRVELIVEAVAEGVHMEVRDTGAGIPAAQLSRIFQKFYQADNQGAASAKGTGLGLAIAKEIVEAHRGTITVESSIGVGTDFSITLPARAVLTRCVSGPHAVTEGVAQ
jgi:signal transduction histidine kinase